MALSNFGLPPIMITIIGVILLSIVLMAVLRLSAYLKLNKEKQRTGSKKIIAFFHPQCDAAGGGEKVLF
jgi:hypothetical protein